MIDIDDVLFPEPDGRAARGPNLHKIDVEAMRGIHDRIYADELAAAKALAPLYRPGVWSNMNKYQRRDYIKSKQRKYKKMMARLDPSQA